MFRPPAHNMPFSHFPGFSGSPFIPNNNPPGPNSMSSPNQLGGGQMPNFMQNPIGGGLPNGHLGGGNVNGAPSMGGPGMMGGMPVGGVPIPIRPLFAAAAAASPSQPNSSSLSSPPSSAAGFEQSSAPIPGPLPLPGAGRGVIIAPPTGPSMRPVMPSLASGSPNIPTFSPPASIANPLAPPHFVPGGVVPSMMPAGMMRPQMVVRPLGGQPLMMMNAGGLAASPLLMRSGNSAMVAPTIPEMTPAQKKLQEEKKLEAQKKADLEAEKMMLTAPKASKISVTYSDAQDTPAPAPQEPTFADKDEAKAAFLQLLEDKGVLSSESWKECMQKIIFDPRYKALKSMNARKEAFEEYKNGATEREERESKRKKKEGKEKLLALFRSKPKLDLDARYRELESIFGDTSAWKDLDRRTREDVFQDYKDELEQKEKDMQKKIVQDFRELMQKEPRITWDSRWKDAEGWLEGSAEFEVLDRKERQSEFSDYVKELRAEHKAQKEQEAKVVKEGFFDLLTELTKALLFHAKSRFGEIQSYLDGTADTRYAAVIRIGRANYDEKNKEKLSRDAKDKAKRQDRKKRRGSDSEASTDESEKEGEREKDHEKSRAKAAEEYAEDLFDKFCSKLDDEMREDRRSLKAIMEKLEVTVKPDDSVASLTERCGDALADCEQTNLPLLFTEMIDEAKYQETLDKESKKKTKSKKKSKKQSPSKSPSSSRRSKSPSENKSRSKSSNRSRSKTPKKAKKSQSPPPPPPPPNKSRSRSAKKLKSEKKRKQSQSRSPSKSRSASPVPHKSSKKKRERSRSKSRSSSAKPAKAAEAKEPKESRAEPEGAEGAEASEKPKKERRKKSRSRSSSRSRSPSEESQKKKKKKHKKSKKH